THTPARNASPLDAALELAKAGHPVGPLLAFINFMFLRRKKTTHTSTGQRGEKKAIGYLRRRGYRILTRNFLCRLGEIDIVARKGETIIFAEVRSRQHPFLVDPLATVDQRKIDRIIRSARYYLVKERLGEPPCRFDVLGITFVPGRMPKIRHIKDAFQIRDARSVSGRQLIPGESKWYQE
ncbi:MAG: YraN family protein, partial [bacterium]